VPAPAADVPEPDAAAVRRMLAEVPDTDLSGLADLPVSFVARGWDNSVWRVGDHLSARIPLRADAVSLLQNEAAWGRLVSAPAIELGAAVSTPVRLVPAGVHPYPWLLTTWVEGTLLQDVAVADRGPLASALAAVLPALHRPAPSNAPLNPYRGVDLADSPRLQADVLERAFDRVGTAADGLQEVYLDGCAAARWNGPRVWCHGDLHPRNLLRRHPGDGPVSALGILDLGDLTAGDPAVDLAVLWLSFSALDREAALERLPPAYDDSVVDRARGWAARFVLAVSGVYPEHFQSTIEHATSELLS
jgi:aminoglycoside phosphotransferase (APT) family kinase protein